LNYSFHKSQRLCSRKEKNRLFKEGRKIFVHPLLVHWLPGVASSGQPAYSVPRVMFLVAKKNFPRAVDRNCIRRRMREAWRLNAGEQLLATADGVQSAMFSVHYVAGVPISFVKIQSVLCEVLQRLPRKAGHNMAE
jgi:ribonuclease P protein component